MLSAMARGILRRIGDFLFGDDTPRERASTAIRRATRERQAEEEAFQRFMKMREQIFSEYERLNRFRRHSDLLETLSIMREIRNFSEEFANGNHRESSVLGDIAQLASSLFLLGKGLPLNPPSSSLPQATPSIPARPPGAPTPSSPSEHPPSRADGREVPSPQTPHTGTRENTPDVHPLTEEQALVVGIQILLADAVASGEDPDLYVELILSKLDAHPELKPYALALAEIPAERLIEELRRFRPTLPTEALSRTARFQSELKDALSGSGSEDDLGGM
jgi:hypothetical protein